MAVIIGDMTLVPEAEAVIEIAENAGGNQGQGDGQEQILTGTTTHPDHDQSGGKDGDKAKDRGKPLAKSEQGSLVDRCLEAEEIFHYPVGPGVGVARKLEPVKHHLLRKQVQQASGDRDRQEQE